MLNTLINDDEHLVHMCFCDEAPSILEDMFIKGKKYVSFSRGMPLNISHGDTTFVFNRSHLEAKGYKFINIEYTREFLDKNPDLNEHVIGDDFNIANIRKLFKKDLKELEKHKTDNSKLIRDLKKQKKALESKDMVPAILKTCSFEKESVLCDTCMDFEIDDIDAIICSSRTVHKYYPLPKEFLPKITYVHDYLEPKIFVPSPLYEYWKSIELYFDAGKEYDFAVYILKMYHYTYQIALNVEARMMAKFEPKPVMGLSSIFEKAFANLSKINEDDKPDYVGILLNQRILFESEDPQLEDFFSEIFKKYCIE